jgi:hypothetical protein
MGHTDGSLSTTASTDESGVKPMPDDTAYCINGCGQPAIAERIYAITHLGEEIVELICDQCANG